MSKTLKELHEEYIAKAKAGGTKTLTYRTPCCGKFTEDRVPSGSEVWDSLTICPHCERRYFKVATRYEIYGCIPEGLL